MDNFSSLFLDKTGNDWEQLENFKKVPGKHNLVDVDFDAGDMVSLYC